MKKSKKTTPVNENGEFSLMGGVFLDLFRNGGVFLIITNRVSLSHFIYTSMK